MLRKFFLQRIKLKLEKEKAAIEEELRKFANKDKKLKGDWDTRFPHYGGEAGSSALEKAADEVEEYEARLPVEFSLESRLKDIDLALEKLKKEKYGICEKCGKKIPEKRIQIYPEARFCLKCKK